MAKIVLVEDDESLAGVIKSSLEQEAHLVKAIHNGLEAQAFILANQADLIVLDWDLPGLSGIEILKDFRTFGGSCPVLMLTGHGQVEDKELGFDSGADDYLTKPFAVKEFMMRVKALLRRSQATVGNVLTIGDIVIDFDTSKVLKSGKNVTLVTREFQLLTYLAKNRQDSVSANDLLSKVWTADAEMTPEVLSSVARRLSKKLDPDGRILRLDSAISSITSELPIPNISHGEMDAALDPMLGRLLDGKYEIIKAIGGGASGTVYKAKHKHMNTQVAVKILAPQLSMQPDLVRRFEREARAAALIRHRNVIIIHDMGHTEESQPYIVMELLNGFSLAELLEKNGKLAPEDAIEIVQQLCQGIARAHGEGLTHRDLKPGNIMLVAEETETFTVKIVDFGLAKSARQEDGARLTQTGALIGTPSYMSPEQCNAEAIDPRSDIYSIGCILYELLTGNVPFVSNNLIEIFVKHAQDPPPQLVLDDDTLNPRAVRGLQYCIHTCMAKQRESRYQSSEHLLKDLTEIRAVLHGELPQ